MSVGGKTTRRAVRRQHQGMSDSEVYQDDHVPEGARSNRWQSLHVMCKYHNHHKPVYSLQRHRDEWHVETSAKNAFHWKYLVCGLETTAHLPASKEAYWRMQYKVEPGDYLPLRDNIPKATTKHSGNRW